jgi:putative beta-lactamase hcpC
MKKIFLPLIAASVLAVGADINALQKECDDEKGASCYKLGVLYDNAREGAAQDYQKAAELYSKACELGNGGGCYYLGNLYGQGQGVKKDTNAAKNTSKKRAIWSRS